MEKAFAITAQMRHDNEGCVGLLGHAPEKAFHGSDAAGRGTNADYRKLPVRYRHPNTLARTITNRDISLFSSNLNPGGQQGHKGTILSNHAAHQGVDLGNVKGLTVNQDDGY